MPNEKLFEAYANEVDPAKWLLGGFPLKVVKMTGYEVAENYYKTIIGALKYLEEGKTISYECTITAEAEMHRIQKKGTDVFAYQSSAFEGTFELNMNKVLNLLFKQAPFIPIIGYANSMDLTL